MAIHVSWGNTEQTIIYWQFEGRWQWSEFDRAWATSGEWMQGTPHQVDFILDFQASTLMPPNIISRMRETTYERLKKFQGRNMNVFLCDDMLLRLMLTSFASLFVPDLLYAFAKDPDEAQAIIAKYRQPPPPA